MIRSIFLFAALALSGCMQVQTNVEAHSSIPPDIAPKTVFLIPYNPSDGSSLEWRTNAGILASVFNEKGFQVVSRKQDARLTAKFGYVIDEGQAVQSNYSIPQYGVTGYSAARTTGNIYGNSYTANTTLTPTYGVTGYISGTQTDVLFTRGAVLDIVDNTTRQTVFEGRAVSVGSCFSFSSVAPQILGALLSNFPAGKTGRVDMQWDGSC